MLRSSLEPLVPRHLRLLNARGWLVECLRHVRANGRWLKEEPRESEMKAAMSGGR